MEMRIRRARRTDYANLAALGRWPGVEGNERRSIRLFRKVVGDLGCDPLVVEDESGIVGFVSLHYARVLSLGGQLALLDDLVLQPGIPVRPLLEHACSRAHRRGALRVRIAPQLIDEDILIDAGFELEGSAWVFSVNR